MNDAIHEMPVAKTDAVQSSSLAHEAISALGTKATTDSSSKGDKSSASKFLPEGPTIVMDKGEDNTPSLKSESSTSVPADSHLNGAEEGLKPLRK